MRSPHTSYRWRGESHSANQVYAPTTHQLQVERVKVPIKWMRPTHTPATGGESHSANQVVWRSPHTSYRWRGERDIEPINCMLLTTQPATCGEERERHRANQVYVLTTHQLQVERRERHRANQVYALTTHQLQVERRERHRANQVYALATPPATGGEEREDIEPIKCMRSPHTQLQVERRET